MRFAPPSTPRHARFVWAIGPTKSSAARRFHSVAVRSIWTSSSSLPCNSDLAKEAPHWERSTHAPSRTDSSFVRQRLDRSCGSTISLSRWASSSISRCSPSHATVVNSLTSPWEMGAPDSCSSAGMRGQRSWCRARIGLYSSSRASAPWSPAGAGRTTALGSHRIANETLIGLWAVAGASKLTDNFRIAQRPRNRCQRVQVVRLGICGQQQQKHEVDWLAVDCVECDGPLGTSQQAEWLLQPGNARMGNRDSAAHAGRPQFFASEHSFRDVTPVKRKTICCPSRELIQERKLIDSTHADDCVAWSEKIFNFHDLRLSLAPAADSRSRSR